MAASTVTNNVGPRDGSMVLITWPLTTADHTGNSFEFSNFADRTWQASGTFGDATLAFEGSNDGTNWFALTNVASGSAATLTAAGGLSTIELPRYGRPRLSTVGSGASIAVSMLGRRAPE